MRGGMNTNILALASSLSYYDLLERVAAPDQGTVNVSRARCAPGHARHPSVLYAAEGSARFRLLHAGARASPRLRRQCRLCGSSLPTLFRDPRPAELRHGVAHCRSNAVPAPHSREPCGGVGPGQWPNPARDRGPRCGAGAAAGCRVIRRKVPIVAPAAAFVFRRRRGRRSPMTPPRCRQNRRHHSERRRWFRRAGPSSRPRRPTATASSSRSGRKATTRFGVFRICSVVRSQPATQAPSSSALSRCFSRRSRKQREGATTRPRRARPIRSGTDKAGGPGADKAGPVHCRRVMSQATSSAPCRSAMAVNADSSARAVGDAPSARSWSSITSSRMPWAGGTVENISLRCRRHNQYESELVFGGRGLSEDREYGPWQRMQRSGRSRSSSIGVNGRSSGRRREFDGTPAQRWPAKTSGQSGARTRRAGAPPLRYPSRSRRSVSPPSTVITCPVTYESGSSSRRTTLRHVLRPAEARDHAALDVGVVLPGVDGRARHPRDGRPRRDHVDADVGGSAVLLGQDAAACTSAALVPRRRGSLRTGGRPACSRPARSRPGSPGAPCARRWRGRAGSGLVVRRERRAQRLRVELLRLDPRGVAGQGDPPVDLALDGERGLEIALARLPRRRCRPRRGRPARRTCPASSAGRRGRARDACGSRRRAAPRPAAGGR